MSTFQDFVARLRRAVRAFESKRTDHESSWTFRVAVEPDALDGGWVAECVDLPGCMAQGETEQEAVECLASVIVDVIQYRMDAQVSATRRDDAGNTGRDARREFALTV